MKKMFLMLGVGSLLFGFSSCKKECTCWTEIEDSEGNIVKNVFYDEKTNPDECSPYIMQSEYNLEEYDVVCVKD